MKPHPCAMQLTNNSSSPLLRFDDEFDPPTLCVTNIDAFTDSARGPCRYLTFHGNCTSSFSVLSLDLEPQLGPWACRYFVSVPILGARELPVPASKTTWPRAAEFGRLSTSESRSPQVSSPNGYACAPTPAIGRSMPNVGFNQSLAFRRFDEEDGSSTSVYAEHYRRHCTAMNVGSAVVGERTLADLDSSYDLYLRQMRSDRDFWPRLQQKLDEENADHQCDAFAVRRVHSDGKATASCRNRKNNRKCSQDDDIIAGTFTTVKLLPIHRVNTFIEYKNSKDCSCENVTAIVNPVRLEADLSRAAEDSPGLPIVRSKGVRLGRRKLGTSRTSGPQLPSTAMTLTHPASQKAVVVPDAVWRPALERGTAESSVQLTRVLLGSPPSLNDIITDNIIRLRQRSQPSRSLSQLCNDGSSELTSTVVQSQA